MDSAVYFDLRSDAAKRGAGEAGLKDVAATLRDAPRKRGFPVTDLFGSSGDVWGFSIDYRRYDISVGVSPNQLSRPQRWFADVLLDDPGWFSSTQEHRLSKMKLVERAVHNALTVELGAQHVAWFLGEGHIDQRQSRSEP